jgi:hypothetical protein
MVDTRHCQLVVQTLAGFTAHLTTRTAADSENYPLHMNLILLVWVLQSE